MVGSIRLVFLVVGYAGIGLFAGYVWTSLDAQNEGRLTELSQQTANFTPEQRAANLQQLAEEGGPMAQMFGELLYDPALPPLAMIVLQGSSWILPLLILLVGYNRIAEDLESRYTRYIMQRVHRDSYLGGKVLGHAAVCIVAVLAVQGLWIVLASVFQLYGAERMWGATIRIWPAMVVYVLAFATYTMLVSTLFARSMLALLLGTLMLYAIWFALNVASFVWAPLGEIWLSSWYGELYRLRPVGILVFFAYTAAFLLLANTVLRRIDL